MRTSRVALAFFVALLALAILGPVPGLKAAVPDGALVVRGLHCECRRDPVGIDAPRPRLGWILEPADPSARGLRQTAYRVLVASSPEILAAGRGDLWDSDKVASAETHLVPYAGKPLASWSRCRWKVKAWDQEGRPSPWSEPAEWTMGLLSPGDWKGGWIQAPGKSGEAGGKHPFDGCSWVWFPEADPKADPPPGSRFFRKQLDLPAGAVVESATAALAADNAFVLYLGGKEAGRGEAWESAGSFDVRARLSPGANAIAVAATNGGTGPNPAGLIGILRVRLAGGREIVVPVDGSWRSSDREAPGWRDAGFDDSSWKPARVLGPYGMEPWKQVAPAGAERLPILRREFTLERPVRRAIAAVCGLGQFELRVSGRKAGDAALEPGWTNYRKTCLYSVRDVTSLLVPGRNTLGVLLGNGMYNVTGGRYVKFKGSFGPPKMILQLRIEHHDGSVTEIATDGAWKTAAGPIIFSCTYGGEDFDARAEPAGWDRPGFDDSSWAAAEAAQGPGGRLAAAAAPEIRVMEEFKPVRVTQPRPGIFVYDLGQNFSGRPRIAVRGPAGATVKLVPGELLETNGTVSQRSSGGPVWFSYTLEGGGPESWHPRFSYYGFRYVQVEGAVPESEPGAPADRPRILELAGQFTHAAADRVGEFTCSSDALNRIHALILAAIRSNFQSVLTDCPHREKLGWLEVSHLLAGGILYNYDAATFYAKVQEDMRESQTPEGLVPDIAPEYTVFGGGFRDSPEWGSAVVINPWHIAQMYGDTSLLRDHFDAMKKYVAYLGSKAKGHIVSHGLGDWYDIGPRGPGESQLTSRGVTATATWYQDIAVLRDAARLLGRDVDARNYAALARDVRAAFNAAFFKPEAGHYDRNSQTANAMPLVLGLVPEERRAEVLENLVRNVRAGRNRVTAGDVGFIYLVRALSDGGRGDVLHDMVTQTEGPGYRDQLRKGATSLTEAWDANPASSHNHCMLGHAEEWFYRGLAGIRPDPAGPGFRRFAVRPEIVGDIAWVKAHYDSARGRIESLWRRSAGGIAMEVTVPPGTAATIRVPAKDAASVTESGKPLAQAPGVTSVREEAGAVEVEVGSGRYAFEAK